MKLNLSTLFALVFGAFSAIEVGKAEVDAGGTANSPKLQVGSDNGKPLYARMQLSTDPEFGAAATTAAASTSVAQVAAAISEGAAMHEAASAHVEQPAEKPPAGENGPFA